MNSHFSLNYSPLPHRHTLPTFVSLFGPKTCSDFGFGIACHGGEPRRLVRKLMRWTNLTKVADMSEDLLA